MAQQNKKPSHAVDSRRADLEADLIGEVADESGGQERETGRRQIQDGNKYQQRALRTNRGFTIQQGKRVRHPARVLNQYDAVNATTSDAGTTWEAALMHETKRVELPKEFQSKGDDEMMANQMGIVTTALDNYQASKNKLQRMHLVNI